MVSPNSPRSLIDRLALLLLALVFAGAWGCQSVRVDDIDRVSLEVLAETNPERSTYALAVGRDDRVLVRHAEDEEWRLARNLEPARVAQIRGMAAQLLREAKPGEYSHDREDMRIVVDAMSRKHTYRLMSRHPGDNKTAAPPPLKARANEIGGLTNW